MEINAYITYCKSRGVDKVVVESTTNGNLFVTLEKRAAFEGQSQWFKAKFVVDRSDIYSYEDVMKSEKDFFETTNAKIEEVLRVCSAFEASRKARYEAVTGIKYDENEGKIDG